MRTHETLERLKRRFLAWWIGIRIDQPHVREDIGLAFEIEQRKPQTDDAAVFSAGGQPLFNLFCLQLFVARGVFLVSERSRSAAKIGSAVFGGEPDLVSGQTIFKTISLLLGCR